MPHTLPIGTYNAQTTSSYLKKKIKTTVGHAILPRVNLPSLISGSAGFWAFGFCRILRVFVGVLEAELGAAKQEFAISDELAVGFQSPQYAGKAQL